MKTFIKTYWKTLLFFLAGGLVGGLLLGWDLLASYPADLQQQILKDIAASGLGDFPVEAVLGISTALQGASYALLLGAPGILIAKKIGLWKDETTLTKRPLIASLTVAVLGGAGIILPDLLVFNRYSQPLADLYAVKPSLSYTLGAVIYGGILEEVMLRLFTLSLVAFLLHRLLRRKQETVSTAVLVAANLIAALLFAAGHLPNTAILFGGLTSMLLVRCFLLNGAFGLAFGWLYRKYGLRYAMMAHAGCHVVSKLIWFLFI